MMEFGIANSLSRTFRRGTDQEAYRRLLWQHRERQERERRQKQEQFDEGESDLIDLATAIITTEQAELFQEELDIYQTATIEALDENRRAIELARERLDDILAEAHVLKDGRRVFKTEDGTRVFDE